MSGHSHWAGIKHKKALIDNKRGKLWSKLSKAIIIAARSGGGDPAMNLRLRYAIDDAKSVSMPKENITRAIKKGIGEIEGGSLDEVFYEGYGPCGVAILCEILTDNRNRTAPEIRNLFERNGGKLGATGCVAWMFDRKGLIVVPKDAIDEDTLIELALEAGADDVQVGTDSYEILSAVDVFSNVSAAIDKANLKTDLCKIAQIPKEMLEIDVDNARKVLKLLNQLDEHDDVQNVSANLNVPDEIMEEIGSE
ncbi:MAG: YebC/PmpR family DNA-binding transcriptional regulator [Pirellulales bacterium]|nr:YebC/PmpR family DNA-binding transcriptional regulator [Pirellulales bacterium]